MTSIIQFQGVTRSYHRGGEELVVLDRLDLEVAQGEFVALMGPSGSGKTTILNLAGALDVPDQGSIVACETKLGTLSRSQLANWRARHIGFVFQSFNLIPVLTARENVLLALQLAPLSNKDRKKQADFALSIVDMSDRADHRPSQLSGGQEQRVAIARALATDPDLILADEPTGDLDRASADGVMNLLARLNQELGKTVLMVTHDAIAAESAGRVLHLDKGELQEATASV